MGESVFIIFLTISVIVAVVSITVFFFRYFGKKTKDSFFKPFYILLLGVFIAAVLLFIPVFYIHYDFGDTNVYVRPFLLSVKTAFAIFFVNEDYELIKSAAADLSKGTGIVFSVYAAILFVLAPVLTVGTLISFIKRFSDEIRYFFSKKKKLYVLSDVNRESLYLAKSIREKDAEEKNQGSVIIFQNNKYKHNEEFNKQIKRLGLIHRNKDVIEKLGRYKEVEFLVAGEEENEDENVSKAIEIVNSYNQMIQENSKKTIKTKVAVYIFSGQNLTGTIIDSLHKENIVNKSWVDTIVKNSSADKTNEKKELKNEENKKDGLKADYGGIFNLRRVDPTYLMIIETLSKIKFHNEETKYFSIMIAGLGGEGRRILKTVLWMYQLKGFRSEINVFDKDEGSFRKFEYECPEININWQHYDHKKINNNYSLVERKNIKHSTNEGESSYDLNFYSGIDIFSNEFENVIMDKKDIFQKTQVVFILTGNDDANVKASVKVREIFSVLNNICDKKVKYDSDKPMIYSVVYDENKSELLQRQQLKNYQETLYHIEFIDNLSSQYSYKRIDEQKRYEKLAIDTHLKWAFNGLEPPKVTDRLKSIKMDEMHKIFQKYADILDTDRYYKIILEVIIKSDNKESNLIDNCFKTEFNEYLKHQANLKSCECDSCSCICYLLDILKREGIHSGVEQYENYEYFRMSSIAQVTHRDKIVKKYYSKEYESYDEHPRDCSCKDCETIKITEHMRWNAYMRSRGYRYGENRNDRAKRHPNLIRWDDLPPSEKMKD